MDEIQIGQSMQLRERVTADKSARAVGSGDLEVYSTPSMIALMEETSKECIAKHLGDGRTSVGGAVNIRHLKPTAVGAEVYCASEVISLEHPKVEFNVKVMEGSILIGEGTHLRFIVDRAKFMQNL